MPNYKYKAKENPQSLIEGTLEAPSKEAAIRRIEEMGYFPVRVDEIASSGKGNERPKSPGRIKSRDLIIFSRQLATLLKSGIPILKALATLSEETHNRRFSAVIKDLHSGLKEGTNLSKSLSAYPRLFSPFYIAMGQAGEDSGKLEEILFRLADYRKKRDDLISMVRLAMVYPAVMALVGIGTVIFMFTFVMPKLMDIFNTIGDNLPLPTRIMIEMSGVFSQWGWAIGLIIIFCIAVARFELRRPNGQRALSAMLIKIPLLGSLMLKKELAVLSRTLELLIKSGIPILRALELTAPVVSNQIIREKLMQGHEKLKQGEPLGKTLKQYDVFPEFMTNLITVGEESGKLDLPLSELSSAYESDTEDAIKVFTSVLEPAMILIMGIVVGFMVVAMLLPIFDISLMP